MKDYYRELYYYEPLAQLVEQRAKHQSIGNELYPSSCCLHKHSEMGTSDESLL